jgi:hypothetical protein
MFIGTSARWLLSPRAWTAQAVWSFETPNMIIAALAGFVLAIGLYDCVASFRPERASGALLILGGVSTPSIAYSMQFISSQLSWAEEMRGCEDALDTFCKARSDPAGHQRLEC